MGRDDLSLAECSAIIEHTPIMIWRSDTRGGCNFFNDCWLAFTGRTLQQEQGDGWIDGVHPDDIERCLRIYLGAFQEKRIFEMKYRLRRHDGVYRWILDRGEPFYSEEGAFVGYVGSCIDITERVEAREVPERPREPKKQGPPKILPICTYCKQIRDDDGHWHSVEEYFHRYSNQDFSHGICPTCLKRLYPESCNE